MIKKFLALSLLDVAFIVLINEQDKFRAQLSMESFITKVIDWLQPLKHFFHQCVISYTWS